MWPFKRKQPEPVIMNPEQISYTQLDITENFDDHLSLGSDDWIETIPLNASAPDPQAQGLPSLASSEDEVYRIASPLSEIRESILIPNDGVYCPVCHIANITLSHLGSPCPKCRRPLLKFGWD